MELFGSSLCSLVLLQDRCTYNLSLPSCLTANLKGSCLYPVKVQNTLKILLLALLPHSSISVTEISECLEWVSSVLLSHPLFSAGCLPFTLPALLLYPQTLVFYPKHCLTTSEKRRWLDANLSAVVIPCNSNLCYLPICSL